MDKFLKLAAAHFVIAGCNMLIYIRIFLIVPMMIIKELFRNQYIKGINNIPIPPEQNINLKLIMVSIILIMILGVYNLVLAINLSTKKYKETEYIKKKYILVANIVSTLLANAIILFAAIGNFYSYVNL